MNTAKKSVMQFTDYEKALIKGLVSQYGDDWWHRFANADDWKEIALASDERVRAWKIYNCQQRALSLAHGVLQAALSVELVKPVGAA